MDVMLVNISYFFFNYYGKTAKFARFMYETRINLKSNRNNKKTTK